MEDNLDSEKFETRVIKTTDNILINISTEFTSESKLIETLMTMESDGPIQLNVKSEELELIVSYMKYSKLNKPNIDLIEKPAMKSIPEYFSDNWYSNFFPVELKKCQFLYNAADYLGMTDFCKIVVAHIGYKLNNLEDRKDVKKEILLPDEKVFKNRQKVFNVDKVQFESMTEKEISEYVKKQSEKWKICSTSHGDIFN